MFRILIDTSVWLDLAKDARQHALLTALEQLAGAKEVELILPRTVVEEFARSRRRVVEDSNRGLSGVLKRAKAAVDQFGDPKEKRRVLRQLNELDHRLPQLGDTATGAVGRIEKLFAASPVIETSDDVKLRAATRAIEAQAPFHRGKNSINDAILIEAYADCVRTTGGKGVRFAFVTHNTRDFSHPDASAKLPHPDLAGHFSRIRSLYFISLGDALRRVAPELLREVTFEEEWHEEPRSLTEIVTAVDELFDKVWYNRHMGWAIQVERGEIQVVDGPYDYRDQSKVSREIWNRARQAARRVERRRGIENLGPWDDFEWGMINGKLSALRWVLGDEWDMLDT